MSFYSIGMLLHNVYDNKLSELVTDLKFYNNAFELKDEEIDRLTYFLNYFSKGKQQDGSVKPGWLAQMHLTLGSGESANSLPKDRSFFGHPNAVFDVKTTENTWMQAYKELQSGNQKDTLVSQFKKVNKTASGNIQAFMSSMKKTFDSFELASTDSESNT